MFTLYSIDYIDAVILRNPSLGDRDNYDTGLVYHRTRSGQPLPIKEDNWPTINTRNYTFEGLVAAQKTQLRDFLTTYNGQPVRIIDHNNEEYLVLITNPEYIITTARDDCNYNIPLDVLIIESDAPSASTSPSVSVSP